MKDKSTYLVFLITAAGHCLPIAVVPNRQVAVEEITKAKHRYKSSDCDFCVGELPVLESNSDVCRGIASCIYNRQNKNNQ